MESEEKAGWQNCVEYFGCVCVCVCACTCVCVIEEIVEKKMNIYILHRMSLNRYAGNLLTMVA